MKKVRKLYHDVTVIQVHVVIHSWNSEVWICFKPLIKSIEIKRIRNSWFVIRVLVSRCITVHSCSRRPSGQATAQMKWIRRRYDIYYVSGYALQTEERAPGTMLHWMIALRTLIIYSTFDQTLNARYSLQIDLIPATNVCCLFGSNIDARRIPLPPDPPEIYSLRF